MIVKICTQMRRILCLCFFVFISVVGFGQVNVGELLDSIYSPYGVGSLLEEKGRIIHFVIPNNMTNIIIIGEPKTISLNVHESVEAFKKVLKKGYLGGRLLSVKKSIEKYDQYFLELNLIQLSSKYAVFEARIGRVNRTNIKHGEIDMLAEKVVEITYCFEKNDRLLFCKKKILFPL